MTPRPAPFRTVRPARRARPARPGRPGRRLPAALAVAIAVTALLLAGCSSAGTTTSSSGPAPAGSGADSGGSGGAPAGGTAGSAAKAAAGVTQLPDAAVAGRQLTRSASLDLRVGDVSVAAARVRAVAAGLDGYVVSEQIGKGDGQPAPADGSGEPFGGFGTLTLSVPADRLDTALDQLARIGGVLARTTTTQDVTDQYVDTDSRVRTMRASVDRVRALMTQAKDIGQVVALETELSRRQADLDALEAQLAAIKGSVARSTVAVSLSTPGHEPVTATGFFAGLRSGWQAFQSSLTGVLTALGAVLPFAALAALVLVPLARWQRRRHGLGVSESPAPAGPAAP